MPHLPLWFLLGSLLLPRVALMIGYFVADAPLVVHLHGWIPLSLGVLVPRALVLILVFQDRGMSDWLLLHAIAMGSAYLTAGSRR